MTDDRAPDFQLPHTLGDAATGALWAALAVYAMVLLSWLIMIAGRSAMVELAAQMSGISPDAMAVLWVAALALAKLIALTFAAVAFGLWIWRRRLLGRMSAEAL